MDFRWSEEDLAFRRELRQFLAETLPADWEEVSKGGPGSDAQAAFSRRFAGDKTRLGAISAKDTEIVADLERRGAHIIDLSEISTSDQLNHGKFASSPKVVQLIGRRLQADALALERLDAVEHERQSFFEVLHPPICDIVRAGCTKPTSTIAQATSLA